MRAPSPGSLHRPSTEKMRHRPSPPMAAVGAVEIDAPRCAVHEDPAIARARIVPGRVVGDLAVIREAGGVLIGSAGIEEETD